MVSYIHKQLSTETYTTLGLHNIIREIDFGCITIQYLDTLLLFLM